IPSLASAILEMRSSLAFCAISMSDDIYCSFCCGAARGLILGARHYKGCAIARTLTEIKIQAARTRGESRRNYAFEVYFCAAASSVPPPKLECTGTDPPFVTVTAQYLNSGILPTGSSTGVVSMFAAA